LSPCSIRSSASASIPANKFAKRFDEMITEKIRNPLSLFDVRDKVAIITGASGSFGHACAVALGALGAKLLLASGTAEELEAVVNDVRDVGGKVASIVRRPDTLEDAEAILKAALDAYGRVDQLVVASGTNKAGFIESQSYEDWQRVMDANVRGPWLMAKAVGSYWIKEGIKGKVLLMSSTRGRHGNFSGYTAYCSSKGATDALTRVLATEWAKYGTTVNAIAPTTFRSKLTEWMWKDDDVGNATRTRTLSRIPLGRLGEAEDLVGMAIYLLSPASDFCTGQVMYVDGGFTAG
jgi:NAD(P)-dependent dehydrogenase (short-subunit alcohol dehydrogenase family)